MSGIPAAPDIFLKTKTQARAIKGMVQANNDHG